MTISIRGARVIDPASGLDQVGRPPHRGWQDRRHAAPRRPLQRPEDPRRRRPGGAPGLVDLSVALREPGYGRKGNVESETRAAAAGGTTSLCCPPYTRPVLDTPAVARADPRPRPRGRQRIARRQRTVEDQLADRALDSRMQRQGLELWMEEARLDRLEQ